jgi:hypothetical protein
MSEVDFSKLLAKRSDDVKDPVNLPAGTYEGRIDKYEFKVSQAGLGNVRFSLKPLAAKDDVDAEELALVDLSQKTMSKSYFFDQGGLDWTKRSERELLDMIRSLGVKTEGKTLAELIPETSNAQVIFEVTHALDKKDPERPNVNVGKVQGA